MKKTLLLCIILLVMGSTSFVKNASAETLAWNNKLHQGTNINYWLSSGVEYTVSIPNAVRKLMYPTGMSNRLVLSKTTVNSSSKMDFYQYTERDGNAAYAQSFRKNSSGDYYAMPVSEKDRFDWIYGVIRLNDRYLVNYTAEQREGVILHEMLHIYGLRDLYGSHRVNSIMYGYSPLAVNRLTSDANAVLNSKY